MSPPASTIRIALSDRYFMFHLALLSQTESTYLLCVVLECQVMQFAILLTRANRPPDFFRATTCPQALRELDITGCSVKADARGMDIGITTVGPIDEARHRVQQGLA